MNNEKERAIDMMRHIAAAQNMSAEEIAGIFDIDNERAKAAEENAPPLPEHIKALMRDVFNVPEKLLEGAKLTPLPPYLPGGFSITLPEPIAVKNGCAESSDRETTEREDQPPKEKDAAALRADMQETIDFARGLFKNTNGCTRGMGFNPEAFSTLMMAYRSAIELAGWEDED